MSPNEIDRQYRVLKQSMTMHAVLRDRYRLRSLIIDIILLLCSVIFCATTFASDGVLNKLGVSAEDVRDLLGVASVLAFFASLVSLRVDWKGKAALHKKAVNKMFDLLSIFREVRDEKTQVSREVANDINKAYLDIMRNIPPIPEKVFIKLKARHLKKVEVSKMLDNMPGVPTLILSIILCCRSMGSYLKNESRNNNNKEEGREYKNGD